MGERTAIAAAARGLTRGGATSDRANIARAATPNLRLVEPEADPRGTTTPNLKLNKPTVGGDINAWGDQLNANADVLDQSLLTTGGTMTGPLTAELPVGQVFQIGAGVTQTAGDPYTSPGATLLGGSPAGVGGSLMVRAAPYGYYDTGTTLSVVSSDVPYTSSRAGISGGFEQGVPAMAAYGYVDTVTAYYQHDNLPPKLTVPCTYTATRIVPTTRLTPAQISVLRRSMWVVTNSVDPSIPTSTPDHSLLPQNKYCSTVLSWAADGSFITVSGWCVPGHGNAAAGQVPPPAAGGSICYLGSPTNVTNQNWTMGYRAENAAAGAQTTGYTGLELDMWDWGTVDYATRWNGIVVTYAPYGGAKPSSDSMAMFLTGQFPTLLKLRSISDAVSIDADGLQLFIGASPLPAVGSTAIILDTRCWADNNQLRLMLYSKRDIGGGGWPSTSLRLAMQVDGTFGKLDGVPMAQLIWNPPYLAGAFSIETGSGAQALVVDNNARTYIRQLYIENYPDSPKMVTGAFNVKDNGSPAPWAGAPTTNVVAEAACYADSNQLRLVTYVSRDQSTGGGWPDCSLRLGVFLDGTQLGLDGTQTTQLVWSPIQDAQGLAINTGTGQTAVLVKRTGPVEFPQGITGPGGGLFVYGNMAVTDPTGIFYQTPHAGFGVSFGWEPGVGLHLYLNGVENGVFVPTGMEAAEHDDLSARLDAALARIAALEAWARGA